MLAKIHLGLDNYGDLSISAFGSEEEEDKAEAMKLALLVEIEDDLKALDPTLVKVGDEWRKKPGFRVAP